MGEADKEEMFDVVDENDNVIGKEMRSIVHKKGLLHRSSHIFIFNSKREVLLQKRCQEKLLCPGKWDFSAAEHLEQGESYLDGAKRGAREELSLDISLEKIRDPKKQESVHENGLYDNEFVALFRGFHEGSVSFDRNEIEEVRFVKIDDVKKMVMKTPEIFSDWFIEEWKWMEDNGFV
jgi:isopentenyl-diphosphate delta-isomerase type 1